LGEKVRYDDGDKKDYFLAATFAARRPTDPGPALRQQIRKAYVERIAALELSIPSEVRMDRRTTVGRRE